MPLQAASAKEASAASREALEVFCLEGEELCRQLFEMQERLSTTEAQLQASQEAATSKPDTAGVPSLGLSSHLVPFTGLSLHIS
jgi:Tfp pilus assembly protein FimV